MNATITTFGPKEYMRWRGFLTRGELVFLNVTPRAPTIADIQRAVASHCSISLSEMQSDRRSREVARPRQIAMYLAKKLTRQSLPQIGRKFGGRDHTTVIHACRQIERLMATDPEIEGSVKKLTGELGR